VLRGRAGGNCPIFLEFLNRIFAGDKDLIAYIQKAIGYCLTGDIREHAMFFGYGTGANGKSVLLSTVAGTMGSYCKTAHQDTFTTTGVTQHPTDVAGLIGARLVICGKVEQGRRWAEAKIKSLTGGDRISARFMRQDFFEFTPQFKLFITGNHKPELRNIDEAMRRRLHLVPFAVTIPEGERDKQLLGKLREEWPSILQWMIEGAVRWHVEGLGKPKAVEDATQYLESEDTLLAWIEDRCDLNLRHETQSARLFAGKEPQAMQDIDNGVNAAIRPERRAVFDERGGTKGFVELTADGRFAALDAGGQRLGVYEKRRDAVNAVLRHPRTS
jgi:putative DNA primase/helicase